MNISNRTDLTSKILVFTLILTLMCGAFYYPGTAVYAAEDYTAYADALNVLGVFEGTGQGYELERAPTRLEGLILFIKLLGEQDDLTSIQTFTRAFDDVPDWGSSFAEYAYAKGYTSGIGNRQFGSYQEMQPNSYVTYLLRALGYETEIGDFQWSSAIDDAVRLGVLTEDDANLLNDEIFTRGHVAYLSYKTLKADHKLVGKPLYDVLKARGKFDAALPVVDENEVSAKPQAKVNTSVFDELASRKREQEIIAKYDEMDIPVSSASYYLEQPNLDAPYKAGSLNRDMIRSALDMIDLVRFTAYLSVDIADDAEWNNLAQHAALSNYANGQLSHYPAIPEGMSDEAYELATIGAKTSNLYYGMYLAGSMELQNSILGYMDDSDDYNIRLLGHRRWLLHPNMEKVGVGYVTDGVTTYSAIRVFDESDNEFFNTRNSADYVAWPSKDAFPKRFFGSHMAWSVSLNHGVYDNTRVDEIEVVLKNETTGLTTTFKQDELKLMTEGTNKYFNIDTYGYGVPFAIVFRPDSYELKSGDVYSVKITGLYKANGEEAEIEYATRFFDM